MRAKIFLKIKENQETEVGKSLVKLTVFFKFKRKIFWCTEKDEKGIEAERTRDAILIFAKTNLPMMEKMIIVFVNHNYSI